MAKDVNTAEFTPENQNLLRAECRMEQLRLVLRGRYQNIYSGLPGAVTSPQEAKNPPKPLMNLMSPFLIEIQPNTRDGGSNPSPASRCLIIHEKCAGLKSAQVEQELMGFQRTPHYTLDSVQGLVIHGWQGTDQRN